MINRILKIVVMGIVVMLTTKYVGNAKVSNFYVAIEVAILLALANATLGTVLRFLTFPISLVTLGFSSFLISIGMIALVDYLLDGFSIFGIMTYLKFGVIFSITQVLVNFILKE